LLGVRVSGEFSHRAGLDGAVARWFVGGGWEVWHVQRAGMQPITYLSVGEFEDSTYKAHHAPLDRILTISKFFE